jgi:hypothetical protein
VITEFGIDSLESCADKQHFVNYPHTVTYTFNSHGYRDAEWPEDLVTAVWCFGDSQTMGMGAPVEHNWPSLLQQQTGARTINISLEGASNRWITRQAVRILKEVRPTNVVIHWSYFHRSEDSDATKSDRDRRIHVGHVSIEDQLQDFTNCVEQIKKVQGSTNVVHSFIPNFIVSVISKLDANMLWKEIRATTWPNSITLTDPKIIKELGRFDVYKRLQEHVLVHNKLDNILRDCVVIEELEKLDLARDGHHYDRITAQQFVNQISKLLK